MNVTKAILHSGTVCKTTPLYQYDYGQILQFVGIDLPQAYEVHFSNEPHGVATTSIGDESGVAIPDMYLLSGEPVYCWLFLHTGEDDGETEYSVTIPVIKRAAIGDDPPTPVEQSAVTQAIAALNSAVEQTGADAEAAAGSAELAEGSAELANQYMQGAMAAKTAAETAQAHAKDAEDAAKEHALSAQADRIAAQAARDAAETAQGMAEDAETDAITARNIAQSAQTQAEGARDRAILAELNAQTAKADAQTARSNAQQAQTAAERAQAGAEAALDEFTGVTASAQTLPAGSSATASYSAGHLTIGIPQGSQGIQGKTGPQGETGATPDIRVGTVSTLPAGSPATAEITGTPEAPVLNLGIPKGDPGEVTQAEFDALSEDVGGIAADVSDLKTALCDVAGLSEIQMLGQNLYIATNGSIGSTVSTTPQSAANFRYAIVACAEGDVFTINATGGSSPRVWCFTDRSYKIIENDGAQNNTVRNLKLIAPENSAYLIINDKSGATSYIGENAVLNAENGIESIEDFTLSYDSNRLYWDSGSITPTTGIDTTTSQRIRTRPYIIPEVVANVHVIGNYGLCVLAYTKTGEYVGAWSINGLFEKSNSVAWVASFDFSKYDNYVYRLMVKSLVTPSSSITTDVGAYIKFGIKRLVDTKINDREITAVWASETGVIASTGKTTSSTYMKTSEFIPIGENVYGLKMAWPVYASSTTFGIAFYDKYMSYVSGETLSVSDNGTYTYRIRTIKVPATAIYFRTVWYNDETTYGTWFCYRVTQTKPYYYICASDSSENDKWNADYVCSGSHDEDVITNAAKDASYFKVGELRFADGTYVIDDFPFTDTNGIKIAIPLGKIKNSYYQTTLKMVGDGCGSTRKANTTNQLNRGVLFKVSDTCYSGLDANTQYAVIGAAANASGNRAYPNVKCNIEHISFILPDNQKSIICIDGYYMAALSFDDVYLMAVAYGGGSGGSGQITPSDLNVGVDGCIAVRGLQGSNFGVGSIWRNAFAWGFGTGFQICGEHIVAIELGTRFCNHGYVFGVTESSWEGGFMHPNTVINCADELNFNLPLFGHTGRTNGSGGKQPITIIDFNMEWQPQYAALGGDLATELTAGENYGSISFTNVATDGGGVNAVNVPFWTSGHGANIKTTNAAHKIAGTTSERNSYTPQYMQQYFDTTLGKMLIYNGTAWINMDGSALS